MNKITFKSINDISVTMCGDRQVGASVGAISEGVKPCYGLTSGNMNFTFFQMSVTYEEA